MTPLERAVWTPEPFHSKGPACIRWIESTLRHPEGDWAGEPFILTDWHKKWLNRALSIVWDERQGRWRMRYRRIVSVWPSGAAKDAVGAALMLWRFEAQKSPKIALGAVSREQMDTQMFASIYAMASESPELSAKWNVDLGGITKRAGPGRMYTTTGAEGSNEGQGPTDVVANELHAWPETRNTLGVITKGMAKRRDSMLWVFSTAGSDRDSILGRLCDHGDKVLSGEIEDPELFYTHLSRPDDVPIEAFERYGEWHPAIAGGFMDVGAVRAQYISLPRWQFDRYFGNRWVEDSDHAWLPAGAWTKCAVEAGEWTPIAGEKLYLGWDASTRRDSTAVVVGHWVRDRQGRKRIRLTSRIWERPINPATGEKLSEWKIPLSDVFEYIWGIAREIPVIRRELFDAFADALHAQVDSIRYDQAFISWAAEELDRLGLPMVEFPQNGTLMARAASALYGFIVDGTILHEDDPAQNRHVRNVAAKASKQGGGWRLEKGATRQPMDFVVAAAMAIYPFVKPDPEEEEYDDSFQIIRTAEV